jgi:hypothetical protein
MPNGERVLTGRKLYEPSPNLILGRRAAIEMLIHDQRTRSRESQGFIDEHIFRCGASRDRDAGHFKAIVGIEE